MRGDEVEGAESGALRAAVTAHSFFLRAVTLCGAFWRFLREEKSPLGATLDCHDDLSPLHTRAFDSEVCPALATCPIFSLNTYTFLKSWRPSSLVRRERTGQRQEDEE